jgi:hypothetical protein
VVADVLAGAAFAGAFLAGAFLAGAFLAAAFFVAAGSAAVADALVLAAEAAFFAAGFFVAGFLAADFLAVDAFVVEDLGAGAFFAAVFLASVVLAADFLDAGAFFVAGLVAAGFFFAADAFAPDAFLVPLLAPAALAACPALDAARDVVSVVDAESVVAAFAAFFAMHSPPPRVGPDAYGNGALRVSKPGASWTVGPCARRLYHGTPSHPRGRAPSRKTRAARTQRPLPGPVGPTRW